MSCALLSVILSVNTENDSVVTTQTWKIGDCKDLMKEMEPNSIDLIVTDPPYGYSFLGKDWDKAVPSVDIWQECLRVLKPGAFAFIMSAPRQDVLAHNLVNLSVAGFETGFTSIYWTYASGFPKAGNIGKMVDKRLGDEREVIGKQRLTGNAGTPISEKGGTYSSGVCINKTGVEIDITIPATQQAKALDGSYAGFSPKPAVEVIMVAMKPLSEKTYTDQALTNGKGITYLDDGRIPYQSDDDKSNHCVDDSGESKSSDQYSYTNHKHGIPNAAGRFPANLLVSGDVLNDGVVRLKPGNVRISNKGDYNASSYKVGNYPHNPNYYSGDTGDSFSRYFDLDAWWTERIKYLPKEVQKTFPFLITPKASKGEKGQNNSHPTVKPVKLFSWLITIGSREGEIVLDPFLGSGTMLEAGRLTNRYVLGHEIDSQWESLYSERCMSHTPSLFSYDNGGD